MGKSTKSGREIAQVRRKKHLRTEAQDREYRAQQRADLESHLDFEIPLRVGEIEPTEAEARALDAITKARHKQDTGAFLWGFDVSGSSFQKVIDLSFIVSRDKEKQIQPSHGERILKPIAALLRSVAPGIADTLLSWKTARKEGGKTQSENGVTISYGDLFRNKSPLTITITPEVLANLYSAAGFTPREISKSDHKITVETLIRDGWRAPEINRESPERER